MVQASVEPRSGKKQRTTCGMLPICDNAAIILRTECTYKCASHQRLAAVSSGRHGHDHQSETIPLTLSSPVGFNHGWISCKRELLQGWRTMGCPILKSDLLKFQGSHSTGDV